MNKFDFKQTQSTQPTKNNNVSSSCTFFVLTIKSFYSNQINFWRVWKRYICSITKSIS